jgi:hypothetical protein
VHHDGPSVRGDSRQRLHTLMFSAPRPDAGSMSPFASEHEIRQPLSPVAEPNQFSDAPQISELPIIFKGENVGEGQEPSTRTMSRSTPTPTSLHDGSDTDTPASDLRTNAITPILVPPDFQDKSGRVLMGPATTDTAATMSPDSERGWQSSTSPRPMLADEQLGGVAGAERTLLMCDEVDEDDDGEDDDASREEAEDHDAVAALLFMARVPSVVELQRSASTSELGFISREASTTNLSSQGNASPRGERVGDKRRAPSPFGSDYASVSRHSPVPKFANEGETRYICRYPQCNKGYASTDAVRKHCRQRHLEWLRRLGHGCPALYCRLGDATSEQ